MLIVRCRECQKEITSHPTKSQSCGCSNMMTVKDDSVTAIDLSRVVMISSSTKKKRKEGVLSESDLMFQEERRKRKVRKLDFEVR
jgi:hypothetical protein